MTKITFIPYQADPGGCDGKEAAGVLPDQEGQDTEPLVSVAPPMPAIAPINSSDLTILSGWLEEEKRLAPQGTTEWLTVRTDCVTASICADILQNKKPFLDLLAASAEKFNQIELKFSRPYATRNALLRYKSSKTEPPTSHMLWKGQLEEQLVRHYLERECFRSDCRDLLFPLKYRRNPSHPWLLASPDGCLLTPLRLVEIKTLQKRKSETGKIPHRYYIQTQIQMDCYQIDQCEYIEARVVYYEGKEKYDESLHPHKSTAIFRRGMLFTQPLDYTEEEYLGENGVMVYYHLEDIQRIRLNRDAQFIESIRPKLFEFWKDFQHTCPSTAAILQL